MSELVKTAEAQLRDAIRAAVSAAVTAGELPAEPLPDFAVEVPADRTHGDLSANVAMVSARAFRKAPRQIAEAICSRLSLDGTYFERAEVAGAGFLNLFLAPRYYAGVVADVLARGADYGRSDVGAGQKVLVEYVSANPTGPMHMGNARGGAFGDCLASVLEAAGYEVSREFYVNDAGNQIEKFAVSLEARYLQHFLGEDAVEFPEDAYHGDDIKEHAANFAAIHGDRYVQADPAERRKALVAYALPLNIERMHTDLEKYRIVYDRWFLESTLHASGEVADTIELLKSRGMTYEKDGALWYKNIEAETALLTAAGKTPEEIEKLELKDDVLVRANGIPTYFAADIAYHRNKFARGFDRCIDVWGADHHGHVARMKGAMNAVGLDSGKLDMVLTQMVRLMRDGEVVKMSKRSGKAIQLADLLDEVPADAARFFFNLRESGTRIDFDLDLAIEQSSSNPVYYVQYAHARIHSIFRKLREEGVTLRPCTEAELCRLTEPEERELIRLIAAFTGTVAESAAAYEPYQITRYLQDLAAQFHKFYNACRVKGEDEGLTAARLSLCESARITLECGLKLLKITAPDTM